MTPQGRAYVISRLTSCPDLAALRRVWESVSYEYKGDADIVALKDKLKGQLK